MYKTFYGLRAYPFEVSPDPRYLLLTPSAQEALASLVYMVNLRKGFTLLTGEVGTGKTTILNRFLDLLRQQKIPSAFVFNPRLDIVDFLDCVMDDFEIPERTRSKGQMLAVFNRWLLSQHAANRTAVLVIDEAQNLSPEMLEEIRLLTNLETSSNKLLQIVLCGQPELEKRLNEPGLRQLLQRISLRCRMRALTLEESKKYVERRLALAGAPIARVFTEDAVETIFDLSKGIPRVMNLICEHSLIHGFVDGQCPISAAMVTKAGIEFSDEENPAHVTNTNGGAGFHVLVGTNASVK